MLEVRKQTSVTSGIGACPPAWIEKRPARYHSRQGQSKIFGPSLGNWFNTTDAQLYALRIDKKGKFSLE